MATPLQQSDESNSDEEVSPKHQPILKLDPRALLSESTCPIYRDAFDNYKPLERLFGTMTVGMAFGESVFLNINESRPRFYNAVALSEC